MSSVDPKVHAGEPRYPGRETIEWRSDGTCNYCGSLSVPEAVRLLRTPGTSFSGTDKTTYKAYIGEGKFYFRHLQACTDAELAEFDALARKVFGLSFDRVDGDIRCRYPRTKSFYGWQTFGQIGKDGEPVFHDGSPEPPPAEFWA